MGKQEDLKKYFYDLDPISEEDEEEYEEEEYEEEEYDEERKNYRAFQEALDERQLLRELEANSLVSMFCAYDADGDAIMSV